MLPRKYGQPRRSEILYDLPEEEGGAEEEVMPDYPGHGVLHPRGLS